MSFLDSVLKAFVGDKSKKDVKELQPVDNKIKALEKEFESLTLDELRQKTVDFKKRLAEATAETRQRIIDLTKEADESDDISRNEDIYAEIDALKDKLYRINEDILDEILPEAYATVKETAKRFVANPTMKVTATSYDRELSAEKSYVELDGDQAVWSNSWDAAG